MFRYRLLLVFRKLPISVIKSGIFYRKMHSFSQEFNPVTGKNEWVMLPENYDYLQEIARSTYGDMLHDTERNHKYYLAIKKAVAKVKQEGRIARVLDIGTGTGLLSMMAAASGADTIYACEAFQPIAKCASDVIKDNGFENKITVISKRSTELTVGKDGDLPEKANILVTEVFDTELIGEGALRTFHHALTELLDSNCIVVPSAATIYAQVVESELISNFNKMKPIYIDGKKIISPPTKVECCRGSAAVHDVQMAEIKQTNFTAITHPVPVFHFDFTGKSTIEMSGCTTEKILAEHNGICEMIFMWWELQMDEIGGDILLSCAPPWSHPCPQNVPWRDHWMQAIYYLSKPLPVLKGDEIMLQSFHDEYSLWFFVSSSRRLYVPHPICDCQMHQSNSRTRLGMLNDSSRRKKHIEMLQKIVTPSSVCLSLGDGSLLPLVAAKLGSKKVFTIETESMHRATINAFVNHNDETAVIEIVDTATTNLTSNDFKDQKIDILISEPYFASGLLPWDSLFCFWHMRSNLDQFLNNAARIVPAKAKIKAIAVEFKDLWKIAAPVVQAEGFDLSAFDKLTQQAISECDDIVQPHPLWEYPCKPMSDIFELFLFDLSKSIGSKNMQSSGIQHFISEGQCNGIVIWVDYETEGIVITTGPTEPIVRGTNITWDMYTRQGVYFVQPSETIESTKKEQLTYKITFNPMTADLNFDFKIDKM